MNERAKERCGEWLPLISKYSDDELTRGERERVGAHLASCASCKDLLGRFQAIDRSIEAGPSLSADRRERLIGLVMGRITAERSDRVVALGAMDWSEWLRRLFSVPVLAAAALLFFVMWRIERAGDTGRPANGGLAPMSAVRMASDERLLQTLSTTYGAQVDWISIRGGDVRVGLPEEESAVGVAVFGREKYVHLAVELAPSSKSDLRPDVMRLMVRDGSEAAVVYAPDEKHRIRLACRSIRSETVDGALEVQVTVLGQSELKTILPFLSGVRQKAGEIRMDGVLFSVFVTSGNPIIVAPESIRL